MPSRPTVLDVRISGVSVSGRSTIPFNIPDFGDASLSFHIGSLLVNGPSSGPFSQDPSPFPPPTEAHNDLSLYQGGSLLDASSRYFPTPLVRAPSPMQDLETNSCIATYESLWSTCIADLPMSDGASLDIAGSTSQDSGTNLTLYENAPASEHQTFRGTVWSPSSNAPDNGASTPFKHDMLGSFAPTVPWSANQAWVLHTPAVTEPTQGLMQAPFEPDMPYPSMDAYIQFDLGQTSAPIVTQNPLASQALCKSSRAHPTVSLSICTSSTQVYTQHLLFGGAGVQSASYPDVYSATSETINQDMTTIDPAQPHWTDIVPASSPADAGHWDTSALDFPPLPFNPHGHVSENDGTQQIHLEQMILCILLDTSEIMICKYGDILHQSYDEPRPMYIIRLYGISDAKRIRPEQAPLCPCPMPGCEAEVTNAEKCWKAHVRKSHLNLEEYIDCPLLCHEGEPCTLPVTRRSLGRHIFSQVRFPHIVFACSICEARLKGPESTEQHRIICPDSRPSWYDLSRRRTNKRRRPKDEPAC